MIEKYSSTESVQAAFKYFQFSGLVGIQTVRHFISSRVLKNHPNGHEFNLSLKVGNDRNNVVKNRQLLGSEFNIPDDRLVIPFQTHTNNVQIVDDSTQNVQMQDTDGLITQTANLMIAVLVADCVPVLLADTKNGVVAALHAGWRGTVAQIVKLALQKMKERFGTDGKDIQAGIGPSISPRIYEVGEEVVEKVKASFPGHSELIIQKNSKYFFDLWQANKLQLTDFGVPNQQIEIAGVCTYSNPDIFYSARKDPESGRFAAGIMIKQ